MRRALVPAVCLIAAMPALAQTQPTPAGRVAQSSVGQPGQRQTRQPVAERAAPMERIASRIQNRVQSRLRSRIDRDYAPQADAASPFAVAEDQARAGPR